MPLGLTSLPLLLGEDFCLVKKGGELLLLSVNKLSHSISFCLVADQPVALLHPAGPWLCQANQRGSLG